MKKSLIYYLSQIKSAYPEITDIKNAEFEEISAEINAQKANGQVVTVHKQLYGKTYRFLKLLANYYAENGLDYKSFNDNLSNLQLSIMTKIGSKAENGEWFLNFQSYVSTFSSLVKRFTKKLEKERNEQKEFAETKITKNSVSIQDLLIDTVMQQTYTKLLDEVAVEELKLCINEVLKTLSEQEKELILSYYGLNGGDEHSCEEIGKNKHLAGEEIRQIIVKALKKLRHPAISRTIYEIYKNGIN